MSRLGSWKPVFGLVFALAAGCSSADPYPLFAMPGGQLVYADLSTGDRLVVHGDALGSPVVLGRLPIGDLSGPRSVGGVVVLDETTGVDGVVVGRIATARGGIVTLPGDVLAQTARLDRFVTRDGRWYFAWAPATRDPSVQPPAAGTPVRPIVFDLSQSPPVRHVLGDATFTDDCDARVFPLGDAGDKVVVSGCLERPGYDAVSNPTPLKKLRTLLVTPGSPPELVALLDREAEWVSPDFSSSADGAWVIGTGSDSTSRIRREISTLGDQPLVASGRANAVVSADASRAVAFDATGVRVYVAGSEPYDYPLGEGAPEAVSFDRNLTKMLLAAYRDDRATEDRGDDLCALSVVTIDTREISVVTADRVSFCNATLNAEGTAVLHRTQPSPDQAPVARLQVLGGASTELGGGATFTWFEVNGDAFAEVEYKGGAQFYGPDSRVTVVRVAAPFTGAVERLATGVIRGAFVSNSGHFFTVGGAATSSPGLHVQKLF